MLLELNIIVLTMLLDPVGITCCSLQTTAGPHIARRQGKVHILCSLPSHLICSASFDKVTRWS